MSIPFIANRCGRTALALLSVLATAVACRCAPQPAEPAPAPASPHAALAATLVFAVEGMVCGACERAICDTVMQAPGVTACAASHAHKWVRINHGPGVDPAKLRAAIVDLGYRVAHELPATAAIFADSPVTAPPGALPAIPVGPAHP